MVHFGSAQEVLLQRHQVLHDAYAAHPERFVKGPPSPLQLPKQAWINPPLKRSPDQNPTETTNNTLVETTPGIWAAVQESELQISILTTADDFGRLLLGPAYSHPSLNKTLTQINNTREEAIGTSTLTADITSDTRYTNFKPQVSQTH